MTKEEKIEKAVEAFDAKQGAFTGSTREGITAAYPILADIEEPTEEELSVVYETCGITCARDGIRAFVRNRNAALQKKKDPRIEIIRKHINKWSGIIGDEAAKDCLAELDRLEKEGK